MSQPFVGEIRMFGGNFAPVGWAFCNGQLMSIAQNEVLFQLIGTTYGGDGQETFGMPDLQGRVPIHMGTLSGGSTYVIGEKAGNESVTLTSNQIPIHGHTVLANSGAGTQASPLNGVPAQSSLNQFSNVAPVAQMSATSLASSGGSQPHDNMMPFLAVSFIISLFGIFPSQ